LEAILIDFGVVLWELTPPKMHANATTTPKAMTLRFIFPVVADM
jgi:hypothetical protein